MSLNNFELPLQKIIFSFYVLFLRKLHLYQLLILLLMILLFENTYEKVMWTSEGQII